MHMSGMVSVRRHLIPVVVGALAFIVTTSFSADCSQTSVGFTPINDLGTGLYLGLYEGGLYPGGTNSAPSGHHDEGVSRALAIEPLDTTGQPDPNGRFVLVSIGMSNTTQEFCSQGSLEPCDPWTFMGQAAADPEVNQTTLDIINGARGGQSAMNWSQPQQMNYNDVMQKLANQGLTEAQVQIAWVKQATPRPEISLPDANANAYELQMYLADIARAAKTRWPNLKLMLFSSRIYAGYASTELNPEPYAYESAFSVKWLIEAQIDQMNGEGVDPRAGDLSYDTVAPWLGWAAYPWADGLEPRSDGLTWICSDLDSDGTHPAQPGEEKVGSLLLDFFKTSPYTQPWFTGGPPQPGPCPDVASPSNGAIDFDDLALLLGFWGPCPPAAACQAANLVEDNRVDFDDLALLLGLWGPCED